MSVDDLGPAVRETNRVLVVRGSSFDPRKRRNNEVVGEATSADLIAVLLDALEAEATDVAIMTPGDPSLVFLKDRSPLAVVVCIQPGWIRCAELWSRDARLHDENALTSWLASVVSPER